MFDQRFDRPGRQTLPRRLAVASGFLRRPPLGPPTHEPCSRAILHRGPGLCGDPHQANVPPGQTSDRSAADTRLAQPAACGRNSSTSPDGPMTGEAVCQSLRTLGGCSTGSSLTPCSALAGPVSVCLWGGRKWFAATPLRRSDLHGVSEAEGDSGSASGRRHRSPSQFARRFLDGIEKPLAIRIIAINRLAFISSRRDMIHGVGVFHSDRSGHGTWKATIDAVVSQVSRVDPTSYAHLKTLPEFSDATDA